uniref:NADH dehydrogenase [ubiquinone] 1 alpha subcomplex subunit 13 n=1 Tax=Spongospora subterranea TaxID=70186 RepID=A0A0H5RKR4_9EUKA|eukprot:CRZ09304.1 hypothetical protein [Spongospora subterranea]
MSTYRQDIAPAGGFPPVDVRRVTPFWGPTPKQWWQIGIATSFIGLIATVINNRNLKKIKRQDLRAKMTLTPLLQALEDERYIKLREVKLAREAEITADDPEWEVGASVYHFPELAQGE